MKELTRTKKLSVSVIGYLAILFIGFLSIQKPDNSLSRNTYQMIAHIESLAYEVYPENVESILLSENNFVFIDIRNPFEFQKGNIDGAINIPGTHLFEKANLKQIKDFVKDSTQIILYANNQEEANGIWMVLYQMGYDNINILMGGYKAYLEVKAGIAEVSYFTEEPLADFAAEIKKASIPIPKPKITVKKPEIIIPVEKVKNDIEEGGC